MSDDDLTAFFLFTRFLKQQEEGEFEEIDTACLYEELFKSPTCQRNVLPLYFFLTRNGERKMSVRELKRRFNCGAELIRRVKSSIDEKKPLSIPGKTPVKPVRDNRVLINLVDSMTRENGALSDSDLANILGTSRATVNRIRHDKDFSYKALRHGPLLSQRHIDKRLAFCRAHENDDWSKIIYTDESRLATSPDCPVMW